MDSEIAEEVAAAAERISPYVRRTYLEPSLHFGRDLGGQVLFKLENLQVTGSFKVRGAFNKLLALPKEVRGRGVVAASTGNHGIAVGYSTSTLAVRATILVPENSDPKKWEVIQRWGGEVKTFGRDIVETE